METIDENEMNKKPSNKESFWNIIFLVFPFVAFMNLGEYFTDDILTKVIYAGVFGGLGGLLGFGVMTLVLKKSLRIKFIALITIVLLTIGFVRFIHVNYSKQTENYDSEINYTTCKICGYKAFIDDEKFCDECFVEITLEEAIKDEYKSLESFIFDQQLFYFTPDSLIKDVNFYEPNISEDGFEKDLNWKPIVPKDSVLKFNQEIITMLKQ